jgi:trigger factor
MSVSNTNPSLEIKKVDRLSGTRVRISVAMPVERVKRERQRSTQRYASAAKLPGFRPGKAPVALVEQKYGDEIRRDVLSHLVEHGFSEACVEAKLYPLGEPSIRIGTAALDGSVPLEFEAEFDVKPEIALKDYRGIPVTMNDVSVSDEEVEKALDGLRERQATLEPYTEGTKAEKGLFAVVELGYKLDDGSKEEPPRNINVELGAGRLLDEIEAKLLTLSVGGEPEAIAAEFPKDADPSVAGKKATFTARLIELKKQVLPEANDAFAASVKEGATIETLKNELRERLLKMKKEGEDASRREQVVQYLLSKNTFEAPKVLVDRQMQRLLPQGASLKDVPEKDLPPLRLRAEGLVRGSLLLAEVAEKEELKVDEARLEKKIQEVAGEIGRSAHETKHWLEHQGLLSRFRDEILTDQVFEFLLGHATPATTAPKPKSKK